MLLEQLSVDTSLTVSFITTVLLAGLWVYGKQFNRYRHISLDKSEVQIDGLSVLIDAFPAIIIAGSFFVFLSNYPVLSTFLSIFSYVVSGFFFYLLMNLPTGKFYNPNNKQKLFSELVWIFSALTIPSTIHATSILFAPLPIAYFLILTLIATEKSGIFYDSVPKVSIETEGEEIVGDLNKFDGSTYMIGLEEDVVRPVEMSEIKKIEILDHRLDKDDS